jgi:hypothetical protein
VLKQAAEAGRLRDENGSLDVAIRDLKARRNILDREIASLRDTNTRLVAGIEQANARNDSLARQTIRLEDESVLLQTQRIDLESEQQMLAAGDVALKTEIDALRAERDGMARYNDDLLRKASQLGYSPPATAPAPPPPEPPVAVLPAVRPPRFAIPPDVDNLAALRAKVEALQEALARLLQERARLADEIGWLRRQNTLLAQQRDALRTETEALEVGRAALEARKLKLQQTLSEATAVSEKLRGDVASLEARNTGMRRQVASLRNANSKRQADNNAVVQTLGGLQAAIRSLRRENHDMVEFITPHVDRLTAGARDSRQAPDLAGLLAVKAYRLAPFEPDDPAHPAIYNALWVALSRLDQETARALISPSNATADKLGTTRTATLVQNICGRVSRALTEREWQRYLPPNADHTPESSRPCPR